MQNKIVIVESPNKAKTIANILNANTISNGSGKFKVISTKGHINELVKFKGKYGLGIDLETFTPMYKISDDKKKLVSELRPIIANADSCYIATDPDREGEAIGKHLIDIFNLDENKIKRIEFFEITKKGVLNGINNPRNINMDLVNSQEARRMLDRIVGFRLSKTLLYKIGSKSAGRVQSVALKLICERENLINAFTKSFYYSIVVTLSNNIQIHLKSKMAEKGKKLDLTDKGQAESIINGLDKDFTLLNIQEKFSFITPPAPFITSTILQKSPFSTKMTEKILQELFEGIKIGAEQIGLITYHRTDSTRLADDFLQDCQEYIEKNYGNDFYSRNNFNIKKVKVLAQGAHEAIRPTYLKNTPQSLEKYLTPGQLKIYSLIFQYAVASQMAKCKLQNTSYDFKNNHYLFGCNSNSIIFSGFRAILPLAAKESKKNNDETEDINNRDILKKLVLNEKYLQKEVNLIEHETEPPARFTAPKLIAELEFFGIGRPSTYGKIITNITNSGYIEIINKQFKPTIRGVFTNNFLQSNFKNYISENFTAELENKLDAISHKEVNDKEFIREFFEKFNTLIEDKNATITPIKGINLNVPCPKCHEGTLLIKNGKYGDFIGCSNYPKCNHIQKIETEPSKEPEIIIDHNCPKCGSTLVICKSKKYKNSFIGCSSYPKCNYMEKLPKTSQKSF